MRHFKSLLAGLALLAVAASSAFAQVPSSAAPPAQRQTYSAVSANIAAPQTGAGDLVCLGGFAANSVHGAGLLRLKSVTVTGIKTTSQTALLELVKRSTADTAGTPGGTNNAVTFTNTSASIGWSSNGLVNGQPIVLETSGTLPTNFSAGVTYYVVSAATNTFSLSATPGGTALVAGSAGSGTHTAYLQPLAVPSDALSGPASGYVQNWTAIPTAGTLVGIVEAWRQSFAASTVIAPQTYTLNFNPQFLFQEIILRGAAQQLCLNAPAAFTTDGPTLDVKFRWTEQ